MKVREKITIRKLGLTPKTYISAEEASDAKFYAAKEYLKKVDMIKLAELTEMPLAK